MFTTVVITMPDKIEREAQRIVELLASAHSANREGLHLSTTNPKRKYADLIHIRKPNWTYSQIEALIREIPEDYYSRIVLHDHHELAVRYHLYGIHLNRRNPEPIEGWQGSISKSCHSIEEVITWKKRCNYVSLSPIYNSISKIGYQAAFTKSQIEQAVKDGIITSKVYALGGVTYDKLQELEHTGFGGALLLGDAWR